MMPLHWSSIKCGDNTQAVTGLVRDRREAAQWGPGSKMKVFFVLKGYYACCYQWRRRRHRFGNLLRIKIGRSMNTFIIFDNGCSTLDRYTIINRVAQLASGFGGFVMADIRQRALAAASLPSRWSHWRTLLEDRFYLPGWILTIVILYAP